LHRPRRIGLHRQPRLARGTPPEQDTRILEVGTGMFAYERVVTVENGKVHLLFQDGSALSVGPNSDIVLDKFVYDPGTKTGELSFSATKGIFRFVGGKISKTTPVTIKTPNATIGIRGGVGVFNVRETTRAALIFGDQLFVDTGGHRFLDQHVDAGLQQVPGDVEVR